MVGMTDFMSKALEQAVLSAQAGEVPVGAVIVRHGRVLAQAHNRVEAWADPTAHAEILAVRAAAQALGSPRLLECDLYVTLEPCPMCAAALSLARIRRVYFGAYDPKGGGVEHGARVFDHATCHHRPEVIGGLRERDCARLLRDFFHVRRCPNALSAGSGIGG